MAARQVMDGALSMSAAMKRTQRTKSPVANEVSKINALTRSIVGPLSDAEMNARLEGLFQATVSLTHFPARSFADLNLKLDILCRRLREFLDPDDRGSVLIALLAESIRDDVFREPQ